MFLRMAGEIFLFILKIVVKVLMAAGAAALCIGKIFLMLLVVIGHIVLSITRIGISA